MARHLREGRLATGQGVIMGYGWQSLPGRVSSPLRVGCVSILVPVDEIAATIPGRVPQHGGLELDENGMTGMESWSGELGASACKWPPKAGRTHGRDQVAGM